MKIFVLCPSGSTTGGPECLHQFGHALRSAGADASMVYYPEPSGEGTPEFFSRYGVPAADEVEDSPANIVVIPEVSTGLGRRFPRSRKAIYWLSVDNYFDRTHTSWVFDVYRRLKSLVTGRLPLYALRDYLHLSQSRYATEFLRGHGLESTMVGDYLNDDFLEHAERVREERHEKQDRIAFNPAKGRSHVEYLERANPELEFLPIVDMTREEVVEALARSKVYLDLGHHPGKDRIPREAALLGCCVLTSRRGSAANPVDVPIPEDYKFDLDRASLDEIPRKVRLVFEQFELETERFEEYRARIAAEKEEFFGNVTSWFAAVRPGEWTRGGVGTP